MKTLLVLLTIFATGCGGHVVRNKTTITAEMNFTNNLIKQQGLVIEQMIELNCKCEDGKWTTVTCSNAADVFAVYADRWDWSYRMSRHLSLDEPRPEGEAPKIRTADEMCAAFSSVEGRE